MSTHAISIQGLHKTFRTGLRRRRSLAVRGLDLQVAPGEVFGFLGHNGAGKTTTIKILVGLLRADAGRAEIFGVPVGHPEARRRLAYLPELPDFYDYLTPGEFLLHVGSLTGLEPGALRRRVPAVLEEVGLDPNERRAMRKFSKGMLQRVGIAQTLLADPDLYIWDEPMGGLDPFGRRWVKDLLLGLARRGKTVFFSSHVLAEAEAICHRVAILHQGALVDQGAMQELLQRQVGGWEITVEGRALLGDAQLAGFGAEVQEAGPDVLVRLPPERRPEELVAHLIGRGHRLGGVQRQHRSLEDVFLARVQPRGEG